MSYSRYLLVEVKKRQNQLSRVFKLMLAARSLIGQHQLTLDLIGFPRYLSDINLKYCLDMFSDNYGQKELLMKTILFKVSVNLVCIILLQ